MGNQLSTITGNNNITFTNLENVGNVTNVIVSPPMEASGAYLLWLYLLILRSFAGQPSIPKEKVAFGAFLKSAERYPAPHCHPNTRVAAKKAVKNWIGRRGFGSEKSIMWINGPPGVGKSAILQTVCEELTSREGNGYVTHIAVQSSC